MKKLLLSVMTIGIAAAFLGAGTFAYFSDTETSEDNQFTAGVIDLEIDCAGDTVFVPTDDPLPKIFEFVGSEDIKPGAEGEVTLSLHLKEDTNDADISMEILSLVDNGGTFTEPEGDVNPANDINDISDQIFVFIWIDDDETSGTPGDNIWQDTETILFGDTPTGIGPDSETLYDLFLYGELGLITPAEACTTYYIGFYWKFDANAGNEYQGDYCIFDIAFYANQI